MSDLTFRPLLHNDIAQLGWSGGPRHLEYISEWIDRAENQGDLVIVGMEKAGELIGLGYIDFSRASDAGVMYALTVNSELRSQGYGTALMEELERIVRDRGYGAIELRVEPQNHRAQELYERRGYKTMGTAPESWEQYNSQGELEVYKTQAVVMRKTL